MMRICKCLGRRPPRTKPPYQRPPARPSSPITQGQNETGIPEVGPDKEVIIALMGVTGAGKSYFIREVTGNSQVEVSGDLHSHTQNVQSYSFQYEGAKITLVDTPGFDDTDRSDAEVLKVITDWTSKTYRDGQLLSGIIYLHPITHARMEGSSMRNLRMFQSLCGQEVLRDVFLTTTQWSNVNPAEGEFRENSLRKPEFWGGLIGKGATLQRFHGTKESGFELISKLMSNTPKLLDIQDQMVKQNMTLLETNAGKCLNEELIAQAKKHKEEIESLERELQEAIRAKDDEMKEILAAEQAKFQKLLEKASAEKKELEDLHAADVRQREAAEESMREAEERSRLEEARRDRAAIAIATGDIGVTAHIASAFAGHKTRGRWILDTENEEEFESNTFEVTICYKANLFSGFRVPIKTFGEVSGTGMDERNYTVYGGSHYWCRPGTIQRGGQLFVIFRKD